MGIYCVLSKYGELGLQILSKSEMPVTTLSSLLDTISFEFDRVVELVQYGARGIRALRAWRQQREALENERLIETVQHLYRPIERLPTVGMLNE
jgi:hypothetical protein